MAQPVTLRFRQGVDAGFVWPVVDTDGTPANLTGWTAASQVRQFEDPTAPLIATLDAFIDDSDPTVTYVGIRWTAAESLEWTWQQGKCDVRLSDPHGDPKQFVWQGAVVLDKAVTV